MENDGWLLYVLLAMLLVYVMPHFQGQSLQDLFDENTDLHHQVHRVGKKHPLGGTWAEHSAWMDEAAKA